MKKPLLLALLPLFVACSKPPENELLPAPETASSIKAKGNGGPAASSAYQLVSFTATKSQQASIPYHIIAWTAVGETNISAYDVQMSYGNNTSFSAHTTVASSNSNSSVSRTLTPFAANGTTYFRLKIYHNNNTVTYSSIKKLVWNIDYSNW